MSDVQTALNNYVDAGEKYRNASCEDIEDKVKARYPTAALVKVTGIVTEEYQEHTIVVLDERGELLNGDDDWPFVDDELDESWVTIVAEGACVFDDQVEVLVTP